MKILSQSSTFFKALPSHFKVIYPGVELADIADSSVTRGPKTILVSEGKTAQELVEMVHQNSYTNLVQFNSDYFLNDLELAALILDKPELYFSGQAHILVKEPVKIAQIEFSTREEKKIIFDQVEQFLSEIKPQNVKDSAIAIVEELYMNAVLDAPKEAKTKHNEEHAYTKGEKAKLILIQSDDRLAISCCDPYGSLDIHKFMSRLADVYKRGAGEAMNMKSGGGAGIGCMIMLENCDNLYLGVIPSKLTVVSCLIPLGLNHRRRAEIKKSLHLITI